jgi:hypothetical protein
MVESDFIKATLPPEIDWKRYDLTWFKIVKNNDSDSNDILERRILIEISEKNIIPDQLKRYQKTISHWHATDIYINDFPLRSMACTLIFKRKRRKIIDTWKVVCIDILAKEDGSRWTRELLNFLK